jgi:hypothetical protein
VLRVAGETWTEPFERMGMWWVVDTEERLSGRLTFDPVEGLSLSTSGGNWLSVKVGDTATFHGLVEGEYWTLEGCFVHSRKFGSSVSSDVVRVDTAFVGLGMDSRELTLFDEIQAEFDGAWSAVAHSPRLVLNVSSPDLSVEWALGGGKSLAMRSEIAMVDVEVEAAVAFRDRLRFIGRCEAPTTFRGLVEMFVEPIQNLLRLALQRDVAVTFCAVAGPGSTVNPPHGGDLRLVPTVHWGRVGRTELSNHYGAPVAFRFPSDHDEAQRMLASWFELHELIKVPVGLRLADVVDGLTYAEAKFLHVAQALEALHRRLYPDAKFEAGRDARNALSDIVDKAHRKTLRELLAHAHEPRYRERLIDLVKASEPEISEIVGGPVEPVITRLVRARNAVTHWAANDPDPDGVELVALRLFADALFDLVVTRRIGLPSESVTSVAARHQTKQVGYWLNRALEPPI